MPVDAARPERQTLESGRHERPPLVLIVSDQEWSIRSLESILSPNGYAVLRSYTALRGLSRAVLSVPDLIIIDLNLPDLDGPELCRRLREDPRIGDVTPIVMTTTGHPSRNERLAALRSGAWDLLVHPIDGEDLLLRLSAFARAKHAADRARDAGLVDPLTGLYNLRGFAQRARELGAHVARLGSPLACVVLVAEPADSAAEDGGGPVAARLADLLRHQGRSSDVIGRVGESEFAVLAPGAGSAAAALLARRLSAAVDQGQDDGVARISVAYHGVDDFRAANVRALELFERASESLRRSRRSDPRAATASQVH
jgi:diguanylate cyclase (GGDEF)-like protein